MNATIERLASSSGTFALGGQLMVHRLGFGAMRITGPGVWGEPADRDQAIASALSDLATKAPVRQLNPRDKRAMEPAGGEGSQSTNIG